VFSVLSVVKLSLEIGEGIWVMDYNIVQAQKGFSKIMSGFFRAIQPFRLFRLFRLLRSIPAFSLIQILQIFISIFQVFQGFFSIFAIITSPVRFIIPIRK